MAARYLVSVWLQEMIQCWRDRAGGSVCLCVQTEMKILGHAETVTAMLTVENVNFMPVFWKPQNMHYGLYVYWAHVVWKTPWDRHWNLPLWGLKVGHIQSGILVIDIPWQSVLYGLYSTEPKGRTPKVRAVQAIWHATAIYIYIYPQGGVHVHSR